MYLSTRGIVFRQTRYSDTSLVVKILTEEAGLGSYIIKGARGPKAKIKASLFQHLNLLDLEISHNDKSDLQHIREVRVLYPYRNIPVDIRKSSILLFLNELMYKSIQEESVNASLFQFIYSHLVLLDKTSESPANFHLFFAVHLTRYLGFFPQGDFKDEHTVFDMEEGQFARSEPLPAENFITGQDCLCFSQIIKTPSEKFYTIQIPARERKGLLENILRYYRLHLPLTGEFRSHTVLHEVLQK